MKSVPYDNCVIKYSINTKENCEAESVRQYLDLDSIHEIVVIHSATSSDNKVNKDVINAIKQFCSSMGNKIILFEVGALTDADEKEAKLKYKDSNVSKLKDLQSMKMMTAILEFLNFISVSDSNGSDYRETYVYGNRAGEMLRGALLYYSAGSWMAGNSVESEYEAYRNFLMPFEGADDRKINLARALLEDVKDEKLKDEFLRSVKKCNCGKHTASTKKSEAF